MLMAEDNINVIIFTLSVGIFNSRQWNILRERVVAFSDESYPLNLDLQPTDQA